MPIVLITACAGQSRSTSEAALTEIRVAFPTTVDMGDVPSLMAHDALAEQGYTIVPTFYAQAELAVEALLRGDADIGHGSTRTYWEAIGKGANIVMLMEQVSNDWALVAKPDIQACADLDGRRFAIGSEGSSNYAMTRAYIQENCPGTELATIIIPGSENRAAALLTGEVDATPVELVDMIQLQRQAPDQFHTLTNFSQDLPNLIVTAIYANADFAAQHPDLVRDYIHANLAVRRQIQADPGVLQAAVASQLEISDDDLPVITETYVTLRAWDVNGGADEAAVQYSLDFYTQYELLDAGLTPANVADFSFLEGVLAEIGRE